MKYFITGATGFIGNRLLEELLRNENEVHILARSPEKVDALPKNQVSVFKGNLFTTDVLEKAIKGCDVVYHLAAYANLWSKDKNLAYETNFTGTKNVLEAALKNEVKKVVFTSSAATLPPSQEKEEVDETAPPPETYLTGYEATKRQAEELCREYCQKGLDVVIVNPSRLYGPGFLNKSNSVTIMIKKYLNGTWRFIPGDGSRLGSYVFIDDVVNGHILAMKKGVPGEKYILGGENISFHGFFKTLSNVSGKKRAMFHIPLSLMSGVAKFEFFMAENFGKPPLITPPWVKRYMQHRPLSSKKAIQDLDYKITPLEDGMIKTIEWIKNKPV